MKDKGTLNTGVQDLCKKLKLQLEELSLTLTLEPSIPNEEKNRRTKLMEQLKQQLAELSV